MSEQEQDSEIWAMIETLRRKRARQMEKVEHLDAAIAAVEALDLPPVISRAAGNCRFIDFESAPSSPKETEG